MSWILRRRKKVVLVFFFLAALGLFLTPFWIISVFILVVLVFLYLNRKVLKDTNKSNFFSAKREIKQYKTLVIGDFCSPDSLSSYIVDDETTLLIMIPDRSLEASYQILLHTVSILDKEATFVLVCGMKNADNLYTVFDMPYLNQVTKKELGIENLDKKARYPLAFEFYRSMRILLKMYSRNFAEIECTDERICSFCSRKNIRLVTLVRIR